jgi:hypothetical protein
MVRLREPEEEGTERKERLVREAWRKSEVDRSNWINLRSPWMNLQRKEIDRRRKGFGGCFRFRS